MQLTPQQQAAYDTLLAFANGDTDYALATLEGYAGTGKTTLIGKLIANVPNLVVGVAAPTNKAVRVLREKIAAYNGAMEEEPQPADNYQRSTPIAGTVTFGSIHSFLGLKLQEKDDGSQHCTPSREPNIDEFDLLVVDECSMIGNDLFQRIIVAKRSCLVLFVGDPAQLPPIEPRESVSPTFERVQMRCTLTDVVRQAKENPIINLSIMLRDAIESGLRVEPEAMARVMPSLPADAGLVTGTQSDVISFAVYELQEGLDARVIAFANETVQRYNQAIHQALHGNTPMPFVPGERVIVHAQCQGLACFDDGGLRYGIKKTLITSEECDVVDISEGRSERYPAVEAYSVDVQRDDGQRVRVSVAKDQDSLQQEIASQFSLWRKLKSEAQLLRQARRLDEADSVAEDAKAASTNAWGLRKAFAPLRHAYALTAHKSQGSTFDTAIVDLQDLHKMRSAFQFNRAMYVAATRASKHLAIVA